MPALIDRAANALVSARSSAELLEARDLASVAYSVAKKSARLAKAKGAHDELIAMAHRVQADALTIEAGAKRRLADEYDAAQERGEVRTRADNQAYSRSEKAGPSDIGLSPKDIHEARLIRDAERAEPGIVRRTLDERLSRGEEPTKAALRRAAEDKLRDAIAELAEAERDLAQAAPLPRGAKSRERGPSAAEDGCAANLDQRWLTQCGSDTMEIGRP